MEQAHRLARFDLLASALAGRTVQVASGIPGEPSWSDGSVIFVDPHASVGDQLEAVAVQASLLAAGSLQPEIVRWLTRRTALARRYLAIEGHRALTEIEDLLPLRARSLIDRDIAGRTDSPAASLAAARSREAVADPPAVFGEIRARNLLAPKEASRTGGEHNRLGRPDHTLAELHDDKTGDSLDVFSSPVGGRGALGRLLQKMLGVVRRLGEGGQPGTDTPTHRKRSSPRGGASAVVSNRIAPAVDGVVDEAGGTKYPEWDVYRRRYRPDWCTVHEVDPPPTGSALADMWGGYDVRRPLARLGLGLGRYHRQAQGDDIDIDAAVEKRVELMAGSAPDEAVYLDSLRRRRDLAVLLLLDVSGSAAEPGAIGQTVHTQQRAAAAALACALHDLGDRVALYAFHSQGRSAVELMPVKRFDDDLDVFVMRRLSGLIPGAYSRLGAAIRHGTAVLERRGGTPYRLLVVLSDGLAYDHGYERVYGAADARHALAEARRRGIGCLCLTVGASTGVDDLKQVFGSAAHATIPRLEQLGQVIGPLFRSALGSADFGRRVA
ncbi:VWA domain-containing protein [Mycobacterium xenopi]|uniref:nitric oxide reductase activation protein NorD n=1 Tax=Mycobacterium xenopi TaxID=1789 RepID=UPI000A163E40|nr:VWA domain-containing protein [Mycobacterium xenopi]MDA3638468.1 VWA domain-containing protein [Mycobacterium xenopi]MDA3661463.1 VWA domain-containing protein [Mycobacterium xenopi]ORX17561.1 nitric oxide reductase activation protein [Mycobacterium xenopi]SPX90633.1 nitric oxide reductase activation protein [Mycobacterium xenopi]